MTGDQGDGVHNPDKIRNPLLRFFIKGGSEILRQGQVLLIEFGELLDEMCPDWITKKVSGGFGILFFGLIYKIVFYRFYSDVPLADWVAPFCLVSAVALVVIGIGKHVLFERGKHPQPRDEPPRTS